MWPVGGVAHGGLVAANTITFQTSPTALCGQQSTCCPVFGATSMSHTWSVVCLSTCACCEKLAVAATEEALQ
jgi:hypothetical protein